MDEPKLRDFFAMAAMAGMLSHEGDNFGTSDLAELAYLYADAMMARRAKD